MNSEKNNTGFTVQHPQRALIRKKNISDILSRLSGSIYLPILSILSALIIGGVVVIVSDNQIIELWSNFFQQPLKALSTSWFTVIETYKALFSGSLGNPSEFFQAVFSGDSKLILRALDPLSETLLAATPLVFTGLAVALGFKAGVFNMGAEGQLFIGALFGTIVGVNFPFLPFFIHLPLSIIAGFLGGALWGFIPGILKAKTGANEVIVTMMLNFVAYSLVEFFLTQPLIQRPDRNDPISMMVLKSSVLPPLIRGLRVNWGFILALAAAVFVSWFLYKSTKGYEVRMVGKNIRAAKYSGIKTSKTVVMTLCLSGGLAGLAGATEILGVTKCLSPGFSPGYGWDALAISVLGGLQPVGILFSSILFGALRAGSTPMQMSTGIPIDLITIIQGFIIVFIAAPLLVKEIYRPGLLKKFAAGIFSRKEINNEN